MYSLFMWKLTEIKNKIECWSIILLMCFGLTYSCTAQPVFSMDENYDIYSPQPSYFLLFEEQIMDLHSYETEQAFEQLKFPNDTYDIYDSGLAQSKKSASSKSEEKKAFKTQRCLYHFYNASNLRVKTYANFQDCINLN